MRKEVMLLIFLMPVAVALVNDADNIDLWCEYSDGTPIDSASSAASDILLTCTADESSDVAVEGDVTCYMSAQCQCPDGTNLGATACAAGYSEVSVVAYTINWDARLAHCTGAGQDWIASLGTEVGTGALCCGDDGASDDFATYSGALATSTSVNCHRCLNGADVGTSTVYGNGYLNDGANTCYFGNVACSAAGASSGTSETCNDACVNDNDGGACSTTHTIGVAQTCYYNEICTDVTGCGYSNSIALRSDYCDTCGAAGRTAGAYCPTSPTYAGTICYYGVQGCAGNTCTMSQDATACTAPDTECCSDSTTYWTGVGCTAGGATGSSFDRDSTQARCESGATGCSATDWLAGGESAAFGQYNTGTATECCEDDAGEFITDEQGETDGSNSIVCCDNTNDCVDDDVCYSEGTSHDTGDGDPEYEICDTGSWRTMVPGECPGDWDIGFGAGTSPLCCGDQATEFTVTEVGAVDGTGSDHCCNSTNACVDDDFCYNSTFCRDTGSTASDGGGDMSREYCNDGTWVDQDNSAAACGCGSGLWNIGGDIATCCLDDANEYHMNETDSALNDSTQEDVCCNDATDCADDSTCTNSGVFRDIGDIEDTGLPTNDRELCENNEWIESDTDQARCAAGVDTGGAALSCDGGDCWVIEAEAIVFGGYELATGASPQTECCGDDNGEYFVSMFGKSACTDAYNDILVGSANDPKAVSAGNSSYVTGIVRGELPNGTYAPLENAWVSIRFPDFQIVNEMKTNSLGEYNISVPRNDSLDVYVSKPGHQSSDTNIDATYNVTLNFNLSLTNECLEDCTRFDGAEYRCDASCDGVNNCSFDPTVTSTQHGDTMKNLCDGLLKGWTVEDDVDWDIECCSIGRIHTENKTKANVRFNISITDAQTFYAGTVNYVPTGELYSVYVVVYDRE